MADLIETREVQQKVILVAVCAGYDKEEDVYASLDELEELCDTAGAVTVMKTVQNRPQVHQALYVGTGKVAEIRDMIAETGANGIVCDDELTPSQMSNLEQELDCRVMDRTMVILDIFAKHAVSREGKIQVELAQLRYNSSHLTGKGIAMSRLGGGIGTRGPGEKKLETDRRAIRTRIGQLKAELDEIERHRDLTRDRRRKTGQKVAAIVGYTNAGKSTLLNSLTGADILAEDMLFATLDTTTRLLELSGKQEILLTDTVGFIKKLPHNLIDAFKSTLEEAKYADFIIHVVDGSNPKASEQMATVYETLHDLDALGKPILTLFNKADLPQDRPLTDPRADKCLYISAKEGTGFDKISEVLSDFMRDGKHFIDMVIPYSEGSTLDRIRKKGELLMEEYEAEGIHVQAYVPLELGLVDVPKKGDIDW